MFLVQICSARAIRRAFGRNRTFPQIYLYHLEALMPSNQMSRSTRFHFVSFQLKKDLKNWKFKWNSQHTMTVVQNPNPTIFIARTHTQNAIYLGCIFRRKSEYFSPKSIETIKMSVNLFARFIGCWKYETCSPLIALSISWLFGYGTKMLFSSLFAVQKWT